MILGRSVISILNAQEPIQFKVIDELKTYLQSLPEYEAWGRGSAKSVEHLWEEIRLGESVITQEGARKVRVVVGELRQSTTSDLRLVELEQTLSDGRKRVRSRRPMAEKIIGDENPMRCDYTTYPKKQKMFEKSCK